MASAGTVTVDFAAEVARFNAQLKTVQTSLGRLETGFVSLQRVAKTALGFFSIGIAVNFVKSAAQAADALGKMADKLQLSTAELKAFQIAATEAGVATETANKILADSQRRLGDAAQGRGEALNFIKALGFSIQELQALSPDQLFRRYAEAINSLKNPSDQLAAAQALFGRSASEAFNLIKAGAPALDDARKFVERYALALSAIDTKKIEQTNDLLGRLSVIAQSAGQRIAAGLSPFLQEMAFRLLDVTGSTEELQQRIEQFGAAVLTAFDIAANAAHVLTAAFFGLAAAGARVVQALTFGAVSEAFKASVDENLAKAQDALAQIRSIEEIQAHIVQVLEDSQRRAEEAVARDVARRAAATEATPAGQPSGADDIAAIVKAEFQKAQKREELWARFDEEFIRNRVDAETRLARERARINEEAELAILAAKERTQELAVGLLQALGARSKAFAVASIVLEKALAIQRLLAANAVAAELAFASQLIPGVPASLGTAAAAKAAVLAQGRISAALLAATGAVQVANVLSPSSGGARLGTPGNPLFTQPGGVDQDFGATSQRAVQVIVANNFGWDQRFLDELMANIREAVDGRDVIIFSPDSHQAQQILSG